MNVLGLVRTAWGYGVDALEPLGEHQGGRTRHWRADTRGRPTLCVTRHEPAARGAAALEDALAATTDLAFALDFVVSSLPSSAGTMTLPVEGGALSATPWVSGEPAVDDLATDRLVQRLHAAHPPSRAPPWVPVVEPDLADRLAARTSRPWTGGPLGEPARASLRGALDDLRADVAAYQRLAVRAPDHPWVATHGDPGRTHQLLTPVRTLLVGWSSLTLAPRERDGVPGDPDLVELFALERRLVAVTRHADRLHGPHDGDRADRAALAGLLAAVDRR